MVVTSNSLPVEADFIVLADLRILNAVKEDVRKTGIDTIKQAFINAVASSLIGSPNFYAKRDPTRSRLIELATDIIQYDGEFLLKVALYTRCYLHIRTTGNFLLALAAHHPASRHYLRRYYAAAVLLPSDWIEVAELVQSFYEGSLNFGALPSALRKVMLKKFPSFDEYQLAKYNKEKKKTPVKEKKTKDKMLYEVIHGIEHMNSVVVSEDLEDVEKASFTLKQVRWRDGVFVGESN